MAKLIDWRKEYNRLTGENTRPGEPVGFERHLARLNGELKLLNEAREHEYKSIMAGLEMKYGPRQDALSKKIEGLIRSMDARNAIIREYTDETVETPEETKTKVKSSLQRERNRRNRNKVA